jgi:hypothetical protein
MSPSSFRVGEIRQKLLVTKLLDFQEILFQPFNQIALRCPGGGAKKRVSERKLRLQEAPEARKLLFRTDGQPRRLRISFL